jgi:hypothetical protein
LRSAFFVGIASTRWQVALHAGSCKATKTKERVDRSESSIPCANRIATLVLEMVQERSDQRRVERFHR